MKLSRSNKSAILSSGSIGPPLSIIIIYFTSELWGIPPEVGGAISALLTASITFFVAGYTND